MCVRSFAHRNPKNSMFWYLLKGNLVVAQRVFSQHETSQPVTSIAALGARRKVVSNHTKTIKNGCNNCFELPLLFLRRIYIDLDCYVAGFLRGKVVRMTIRMPFRVYTKYACTGFYYIGMCQEQLGENLLPNHLRRQGRQ